MSSIELIHINFEESTPTEENRCCCCGEKLGKNHKDSYCSKPKCQEAKANAKELEETIENKRKQDIQDWYERKLLKEEDADCY